MIEILAAIFVLAGGVFSLIAGIGLMRFNDVLMRMHASTKAGTLGSILTLVAPALVFGTMGVTTKVVAGVLFLLLTAPIAAHMIGRAFVRTEKDHKTKTLPGHRGSALLPSPEEAVRRSP
ncbi:MAG: monovalent cation/H(+) antiporter subunit G [Rhodobacteraceae bacterium]|nr:monovalent cation/H(+) antiporter subunit G [Paracoccaceae bacterium]